ncbi:hypothetical protein ACHAP5_006942 [Fusarium lateritium]
MAVVQIDPSGDTLLILPIKKSPATQPTTETSTEPSTEHPAEKQFLCSQKHLTFASRRASKIFSSTFKEASKEEDGLYHWKFEDVFDVEAFELVLRIIHGKTRDVPRAISLDLLAAVASIVDDLECHDTLAFFSQSWMVNYEKLAPTYVKTLAQLILASFVFENASVFKTATKLAVLHSQGAVLSYDLPIRVAILDLMESRRLVILRNLILDLDALEKDLLEGKLGCSRVCRSMILGDLLQATKGCGLYPQPSAPFITLAVHPVIQSLKNAPSSTCFSSEQDSSTFKHSGHWRLTAQPSFPGGHQQASTNSLFSTATAVPFQTNTTNQQLVSTNIFGARVTPQAASTPTGLVGRPAAEKNNLPQVLVRHHCGLSELLAPIISRAEAWKTGLELPDYL